MRAGTSVLALAAAIVIPSVVHPQESTPTLSGRVMDASSRSPIEGAQVILVSRLTLDEAESISSRSLLARPAVRSAVTSSAGLYRLEGVMRGRHLLRVERLGYSRATIEIDLEAPDRSSVSVAMEVEPIMLDPVSVTTGVPAAAPTDVLEIPPTGAVSMERYRQERSLASDVRMVSIHDLGEAATMAEMDVFRAMHRLAGVSSRDDWTAELWTRGAAWGETRVYLDGIPLFNPLHGFGVFSGFSYQGMGTATFHPGARLPRRSESGAAVLELSSRSGVEVASAEGGSELSIGSFHAWSRAPLQGGRGGWSVTGRRSYIDLAVDAVGQEDDSFPFAFADLQGRLDLETSIGQVEASVLWESDRLRGELPDLLQGTTADWGNVTGRGTLHLRPFGLRGSVTVGGTTYHARVRSIESTADSIFNAPHEPPADHEVDYGMVRAVLSDEDRSWELGLDVVRQRVMYRGRQPIPYSDQGLQLDIPEIDVDGTMTRAGLWGQWRTELAPSVELDLGVRFGLGSRVQRDRMDVQPTAIARYAVSSSTTISAAVGRYLQYTQSPASMGAELDGSLSMGRYWTLASPDAPALDTRLVTLGAEHWISGSWLLSATLYDRETRGNLLPDPRAGFLIERQPWVNGDVSAWGLDATVRRMAGRWTGSFGYSFGRASSTAAGTRFDAPTDRTHTVDVTGVVRAGGGRTVQLAYTYATGSPYTRTSTTCFDEDCEVSGLFLDDPFGRRSPDYSSLDLVYDSVHGFTGWSLGWFVQLRNVLGHDNAITYQETRSDCPDGVFTADGCGNGEPRTLVDSFVSGMPRAPLIGLRVTF